MYDYIVKFSILATFCTARVVNYGENREFGVKTCPRGWMQFEQTCYLMQTQLQNFQEATRNCEAKGAKMFDSTDSFEWDAVRKLFPDYYFTWVRADVEEELEWLFEPFDETINGKSSVARCIACYSSPTKRYNYFYPCSSRFHSICEKPLENFRQWMQ